MLQGESICCSCQDITFVCPFTSPDLASVRGTLNITNYRLYFFSHHTKERPVLLDLPLGIVSRVDKVSGARNLGNTYGLEVVCKDIRTLKFVLTEAEEGGHPRRQIFEALVTNAFPLSYASQLFAFKFKEQCGGIGNDGWRVYDQTEELKRMGLPNERWLISDVNQEYQLCDTYPTILGLPARTTLEDLQEVAKFRSRGRIPVLSWIHPETQVTITRCAQPLVGFQKRSKDDEQHIKNIMDANPLSSKIYIYDARPKVNAEAMRLKGGGYESEDNYQNLEFVFLDIENIHVMRESYKKVRQMCLPEVDHEHWLSNLEATGWLKHIKIVLAGALKIADKVEKRKSSVLVHCSDGWDRTAQLTSLAMILLDPYFRTLNGFQVLIEKEWLSFGHKFGQRIGHGSDKHGDDQRSPIFLQFIECVWQIMQQFPDVFEFNENLLCVVLDHLYSCLFGTFLCNSHKEREDMKLAQETQSLWSFVNSKQRSLFLNQMYCKPTSSEVAIFPIASIRYMRFWKGYHCRWNPKLRSQDSIHARHTQLLHLRDQLQAKVWQAGGEQ